MLSQQAISDWHRTHFGMMCDSPKTLPIEWYRRTRGVGGGDNDLLSLIPRVQSGNMGEVSTGGDSRNVDNVVVGFPQRRV